MNIVTTDYIIKHGRIQDLVPGGLAQKQEIFENFKPPTCLQPK